MFQNLKRGLDSELDTIVPVLAKRSGEVRFAFRHAYQLCVAVHRYGCDQPLFCNCTPIPSTAAGDYVASMFASPPQVGYYTYIV